MLDTELVEIVHESLLILNDIDNQAILEWERSMAENSTYIEV